MHKNIAQEAAIAGYMASVGEYVGTEDSNIKLAQSILVVCLLQR